MPIVKIVTGLVGALSRTLSSKDFGDVDLRRLRVVFADAVRGTTTLDLVSRGATPRALLKAFDGRSVLISRDGRIKSRYWKLIALDLATEFEKLGNADEMQEWPARSRVSTLPAGSRGALSPWSMAKKSPSPPKAMSTSRQNLDLLITPAPKDPAVFSLATPIRVKGPWADLWVLPDTVSALKSLGDIGLGATVSSALLILPFMSTGSKEPPCDMAVAVAEGGAAAGKEKARGRGCGQVAVAEINGWRSATRQGAGLEETGPQIAQEAAR